jgi:serine O-acetyltransferase
MNLARQAQGRRGPLTSRTAIVVALVRLVIVSDAFGGLLSYRFKTVCQRRNIPVLPRLAHRLAIARGQICIGDPVLVHAGVLIPEGRVVIDGFTEIKSGAVIGPCCTIGLMEGNYQGPTIDERAELGRGVRVLGPRQIGKNSRIDENAVVLCDVEPGSRYAGVPARRVD